LNVVPLIYGQPVGIGPTVVDDGADELVDAKFVEDPVGLVNDGIEFGVYGQEPDHTDGDGLVCKLIEEELLKTTDEDTLLGPTGNMLLVELTRTVVVVVPDAIVVIVSVSTSLPMTPCLKVCFG
jgi:hypothetical protein